MLKFYYLLSCLILLGHPTIAQSLKRANIWYFGRNSGLDFNTTPPTPLSDGTLNTWEGCATICDENGQMLIYTDGSTIWNKNHQIMTGAVGLGGNSSSSQSGIIIPKPSFANNLFVVSVDAENGSGGVQYSEIDMTAGGGLGGWVKKNIPLLPRAVEKLTTIPHCNGRHYWVLAHETGSNKFYAWLLTENGIDKDHPVISSVGSVYNYTARGAIGYMRSSPEGNRIALAINDQSAFELFDFDKKTGKLSNPIRLRDNRFFQAYGVEFSPNGKLLYLSGAQTRAFLYQVELMSTNSMGIMQTLTEVGRSASNDFGALQLASDGRIYIAQDGIPYLSVVENPNQKGVGCGFRENAVRLTRNSGFGLPNLVPSLFAKPISVQLQQMPSVCGQIKLEATTNSSEPVTYQWYRNGQLLPGASKSTFVGTESGDYKVEVAQNKECDTLRASASDKLVISTLKVIKPIISFSGTTTLCQGNSLGLQVRPQDSLRYDWYRDLVKIANSTDHITASVTGTYAVRASNGCDSVYSDSLQIIVQIKPIDLLGRDTVLCEGQSLVLKPLGNLKSIVWEDGSTTAARIINAPGRYWAQLDNYGCSVSDTVLIRGQAPYSFSLGSDRSFCFGESVVIAIPSPKSVQATYKWFNGSIADSLIINQAGLIWLESNQAGCPFRDSVLVNVEACAEAVAYVPDAFTPNKDGINDRFEPLISRNALISAYSLTIYSRWGNVVYNTTNIQDSWDGTVNDAPCMSGLYAYKIKISYLDNTVIKSYEKQGALQLVR